MTCLDKPLTDLSPQEITDALKAAVHVPGLTIQAICDPDGAEIEAQGVDVYVIHAPGRDALEIQCWHQHSSSPCKTLTVPTLSEAVEAVVAEFDNASA